MNEKKQNEHQNMTVKPIKPFLPILAGIAAALITFLGLVWIFYPLDQMNISLIDRTPTMTPIPPTATSTRTPQATYTPTPSMTPTITSTPFPLSEHAVEDLSSIRPEPPLIGESAVILDESDAEVEPPLSHFQWISSNQISEQLGKEIYEPYYATFNPAAVTWRMDQALKPGYYELFVLDTVFSSGGSLDFIVKQGEQSLVPVVGKSTVQYLSSQGDPPQYTDTWQSIGIYEITAPDLLTVSTSWDTRDETSIVAIDRIMILEHSENIRPMIEQLPNQGERYIVDDNQAIQASAQYWNYYDDPLAWGNKFQIMEDPPISTSVTWTLPATVPFGNYEALVWIPQIDGEAEVTYSLYASGVLLEQEGGITEIKLDGQGRGQDPHWISLGQWSIPERFGNYLKITLMLTTTGSTQGEVAIDAAAFIKR